MPFLYSSKTTGVGSPFQPEYQGFPVTPSDSVDVPAGPAGPVNSQCCGFVATGAGNVTIQTNGGISILCTAVPAGAIVDVGPIKRVMATGTTATGISALFSPDPL